MAAHAELLRHDEIKPYATALLGHSEGGLLSLAAAAAMGKRAPYALVLAGTPGRPLLDIVRRADRAQRAATTAPRPSGSWRRSSTTGHVPADTPAELRLIFPPYAGPFLQRRPDLRSGAGRRAPRHSLPAAAWRGRRADRADGRHPAADRCARQARASRAKCWSFPAVEPQSQAGHRRRPIPASPGRSRRPSPTSSRAGCALVLGA